MSEGKKLKGIDVISEAIFVTIIMSGSKFLSLFFSIEDVCICMYFINKCVCVRRAYAVFAGVYGRSISLEKSKLPF